MSVSSMAVRRVRRHRWRHRQRLQVLSLVLLLLLLMRRLLHKRRRIGRHIKAGIPKPDIHEHLPPVLPAKRINTPPGEKEGAQAAPIHL